MVPPSHSRISRFHGWLAGHPGRVLTGALLVLIVAGALAMRLELRTAFSELLPSNDPGVVALTRMQKRMGDLSLLLIGIRSPDYEANLRYAEALTQKLRAQPPNVVSDGDLPREGRARLLRAQQVALRVGGRPRVHP